MPGLEVRGSDMCRYLTFGHRSTLSKHFNVDSAYVLTSIQHDAQLAGDYRSGMGDEVAYQTASPAFPPPCRSGRPDRRPKSFVQGTQTVVVVGPVVEETFIDKYSSVKVQFHWDRESKNDSSSSCWIRVGSLRAGKQWGAISIPRIGQEVLVAFEEGDPDRTIIVGSVYNADMMPPLHSA